MAFCCRTDKHIIKLLTHQWHKALAKDVS